MHGRPRVDRPREGRRLMARGDDHCVAFEQHAIVESHAMARTDLRHLDRLGTHMTQRRARRRTALRVFQLRRDIAREIGAAHVVMALGSDRLRVAFEQTLGAHPARQVHRILGEQDHLVARHVDAVLGSGRTVSQAGAELRARLDDHHLERRTRSAQQVSGEDRAAEAAAEHQHHRRIHGLPAAASASIAAAKHACGAARRRCRSSRRSRRGARRRCGCARRRHGPPRARRRGRGRRLRVPPAPARCRCASRRTARASLDRLRAPRTSRDAWCERSRATRGRCIHRVRTPP